MRELEHAETGRARRESKPGISNSRGLGDKKPGCMLGKV